MQVTNPRDQTKAAMACVGKGNQTGNIRNMIPIDIGEMMNHSDDLVKMFRERVPESILEQEGDQLCEAK